MLVSGGSNANMQAIVSLLTCTNKSKTPTNWIQHQTIEF